MKKKSLLSVIIISLLIITAALFVFYVICIYTNSRFYIIGLILSIIALFLAFIGYMKAFKFAIITDNLNNCNSEVEFIIPYYKTYDTFKYKGVKIKVLPYIDKHSCKQCFFYQPNNVYCDISHKCRFAFRKDNKDVFFKVIP